MDVEDGVRRHFWPPIEWHERHDRLLPGFPPTAALPRGESLLRTWAYQCPQRHQGSDANVLVIHQLFLRERQRFHNGSRLVLGLRVDQEDDAFAIAARIPLSHF